MKTKLFFALITIFVIQFNHAQIDDGSVAPDFTADDIFGNTHNLQDYLDDGKTVILNISATWCGPCWNYMQSGAFKDVYYSHGEPGSDEVVILYVEGSADAADAVDLLYGIGGNTLGNWVDGTPYPIIASQAIASAYEITYFPTVYRICPDGFVYEMGQLNREGVIEHLNTNCSGVELMDEANHVMAELNQITVCDDGETTEAEIVVTNYGANVTSLDFEIDINGTLEYFSENVNLGKWQSITLNTEIVANENDQVSVKVVGANNETPHNLSLAQSNPTEVEVSALTGRDIEVRVYTDNYPGEMSWQILNEEGEIAASGGPYKEGKDDNFGGGGFFAQTTVFHNVQLPEGEQCFSVRLMDSYGDGWSLSAGNWDPGIEIFYEGESIYKELVGNFGTEIVFDRAMKHSVTMNAEDFTFNTLEVYPNPSNGRFNITSSDEFDVTIFNMQGRRVFYQKGLDRNASIQLEESSGVYIAEFVSGTKKSTQKLIIK
ncbi:MAG: T9SS type A sorting domain-containing protein [Flavobacteriaceae bacterium]|nr:T9SS type A sorting domain-containing protein [Flavobacteriaceae bacterium]